MDTTSARGVERTGSVTLLPRVAAALLTGVFGVASAAAAMPRPATSADVHYDPDTQQVTVSTPFGDSLIGSLTGIHAGNFLVYENGRRQTDVSVTVDHAPICIGVLVEYGGRYHAINEILGDHTSNATQSLLEGLAPDDSVTIWKYADRLETIATEVRGADGLRHSLITSMAPPPSTEADLHDALIESLHKMQTLPGHKTLVVLSTGINTFSKASLDDVLEQARRAGVPVYVINLGALVRSDLPPTAAAQRPYASLNWNQAESELRAIARASGGRMYTPESPLDLDGMFDELMASLRTRFVIQYRSLAEHSLPPMRKVRIELVEPRTNDSPLTDRAGNSARHGRLIVEGTYSADGRGAPVPFN
jgi:hypothetical protein